MKSEGPELTYFWGDILLDQIHILLDKYEEVKVKRVRWTRSRTCLLSLRQILQNTPQKRPEIAGHERDQKGQKYMKEKTEKELAQTADSVVVLASASDVPFVSH